MGGALKSKLDPSLFLFRDGDGKVDGFIGVHVDDDSITGSERFFTEVVEKLKKKFVYGKWHTANRPGESFEHCGKTISRGHDGRVIASQKNYALSMEHIHLDTARRRNPNATATLKERNALRSACGKLSWIVRGTRPDLAFRKAVLQHAYNDPNMKIKVILDHNRLVNDAKRDTFPDHR